MPFLLIRPHSQHTCCSVPLWNNPGLWDLPVIPGILWLWDLAWARSKSSTEPSSCYSQPPSLIHTDLGQYCTTLTICHAVASRCPQVGSSLTIPPACQGLSEGLHRPLGYQPPLPASCCQWTEKASAPCPKSLMNKLNHAGPSIDPWAHKGHLWETNLSMGIWW